jgi:uncharacterized protein YidB (DUF937 family)
MANPLIGEILESVLRGNANASGGGLGGMLGGLASGGGLGSVLGGMFGGAASPDERAQQQGGSHRGMLVTLLLPLVMQWVQRNGGIGALLQRMRQQGYGQQADSWVSTGHNQGIDENAVRDVVGSDELSQLSQKLGLSEQDVAHGFSQILPEVVDKLSPQGHVPPQADAELGQGLSTLQDALSQATGRLG